MRDLVQDILKQIGCQPEVNDLDQIVFMYQGTRFFIDADNNSPFIQIFETWWATIGLDNPESEKLKTAVNDINGNAFPTILYSIDPEKNIMGVHCRLRTVFTEDLPQLDEFLRALLNTFFEANRALDHRMHQLMGMDEDPMTGPIPQGSASVN